MKKLSDNKKFRKIFFWIHLISGLLGYVIVYKFITPTTPFEETLSSVAQVGCLLLSLVCIAGLLVQSFGSLIRNENDNNSEREE